MFGKSETLATKINQVFVITVNGVDTFFNQNGSLLTPGSFSPLSITELTVQPSEAIGLVQQEKVHKHWKLTGVKYMFYKDALSSNNGSIATANYQGDFGPRHSKAVYDSINQPVPGIGGYNGQIDQWLCQQKGRVLPTLNGKRCNIWCSARINRQDFLLAANGGFTPVDTLIKFPWLNETLDGGVEGGGFRTGQLTVYMPVIRINPLLANTFNIDTDFGRTQLAQKFQWYVRPVIHWAVKGKYYDNILAENTLAMDDLKLSDSEPEMGQDVCGNM